MSDKPIPPESVALAQKILKVVGKQEAIIVMNALLLCIQTVNYTYSVEASKMEVKDDK